MAVLWDAGPYVGQNNVFCVFKIPSESMRMIWSGNIPNFFFRPKASGCKLPSPDLLATLRSQADEYLFLAVCYVSQNYDRLNVHAASITLFWCPNIWSAKLHVDFPSIFWFLLLL